MFRTSNPFEKKLFFFFNFEKKNEKSPRMERKIFELKKINKKDLWKTKLISKSKKTHRSSSKIVTSELWSISKGEKWNFTGESHLKFGTTDEGQNFQFQKKKNEQHGIMEDRIKNITKTRNCNVLSSKLRPVKDFKSWTMTLYRSYVKLGNNFAPHNWANTRVFSSY